MSRRERNIDAETIRRTAAHAGLHLDEDRVQMHLGPVQNIVRSVREWEAARLGFWFDHESGTFGFAPSVKQYRIPWEYPTPLTKQRVVSNVTGD
jgi:hypothetical protein